MTHRSSRVSPSIAAPAGAIEQARAEGITAAVARLNAIMSDPRVKGKESAAFKLATLDPAMPVDDLCSIIAALEREPTRSRVPPMDERMAGLEGGLDPSPADVGAYAERDFVAHMKKKHGITI